MPVAKTIVGRIVGWAMWPLHALAIASPAKSFRDNPVIGSPRLNRLGLHVSRKRLAARIAERRRESLARLVPAKDREAFLRDGFLVKPDFLDAETFAALRQEVLTRAATARERLDGYTLTRLIPLDPIALRDMPVARRVLLGERYLGLHAFIGAYRKRPTLHVQTVVSGVREAGPDVQSYYHVDTFHPTVKSWLLLTPVAEHEAGFTYVPGSHRATRRRLAWERRVSITAHEQAGSLTAEGSLRINEGDIARLGYGPPVKLTAQPNTLIIADTSGFHRRGLSEGYACRISIWAASRSNPFLPWSSGDPLPGPLHGLGARILAWLQPRLRRGEASLESWRVVGKQTPEVPAQPAALSAVAPPALAPVVTAAE